MTSLFPAQIITDMFVLMIPVLEKVLRPLIVYIFLIVGLRIAGKRELAQINTFDLIVLLTLSNTVQNAIIGKDDSVTGGMLGAASLLLVNYLVVRFLFRRANLDQFLEGTSILLIENGQIQQDRLEHELITVDELTAAAHKQGFRSLDDVERCELEAGGSLTFIGKDPSPMQSYYEDLARRLDEIRGQLAALQPSGPRD